MKKIFIALAALTCATLVPISTAQAFCPGETRVITACGACGQAIYQQVQVVSYCGGYPQYGWVTLPHQCPRRPVCRSSYHGGHHHSSRHHSSHHSCGHYSSHRSHHSSHHRHH